MAERLEVHPLGHVVDLGRDGQALIGGMGQGRPVGADEIVARETLDEGFELVGKTGPGRAVCRDVGEGRIGVDEMAANGFER